MDDKMRNCAQCGNIFVPEPPEIYCADCSYSNQSIVETIDNAIEKRGRKSPTEIADLTGLAVGKIKAVIRSSRPLSYDTLVEDLCSRCGKRPRQEASDYCFQCRLNMYRSFSDAADAVWEKASKAPAEEIQKKLSVRDTLAQKRRRTGTYRFNPSPTYQKKTGSL